MSQSLKDERRRERLHEYEAELAQAKSALAVLALLVQGREARAREESLEEAFARPGGAVGEADCFPAAAWVALRQNDLDATLNLLIELSTEQFVVAEHEQLAAGYRLTSVEETRAVPDVAGLRAQVAAVLHIPADVIAMISGWGAEDPRAAAEIDALLDQRFGTPSTASGTGAVRPAAPAEAPVALPVVPARDQPPAAPGRQRGLHSVGQVAGLSMSAEEFGALVSLTPEQRQVVGLLVRQTAITITTGA